MSAYGNGGRPMRQMSTKAPSAPTPKPSTRANRRHLSILIGALAIYPLTAGCGGHRSTVTFPVTTPPQGPTSRANASRSVTPSPQTARDAAIAAYAAFYEAADKAILAPPEQARSIMRDYVTGEYLDWEIRQLMIHQTQHEEPWGKPVLHVTHVDLTATTAKIHDCQDASNAGLANAKTHQLIPRTRGTANRNLIADMTLGGDGQWRVSGLKQYPTACHAS
jgi:hypothetical protein